MIVPDAGAQRIRLCSIPCRPWYPGPLRQRRSQARNKNRMSDIARLRSFVTDTAQIIETQSNEDAILTRLAPKLEALVRHDDWLPEGYAVTGGSRYRQYLLYADPLDRFSIVSFVWGPNQATPVHDHRVWGLIGVLRGEEVSVGYA